MGHPTRCLIRTGDGAARDTRLRFLEERNFTDLPGGEQVSVTFRIRKLAAYRATAAEKGEGTPGRDSSNGAAICANRQNEAIAT